MNKTAFLLRPTKSGPRAEPIKLDDAKAMVGKGTARLLRPMIYEVVPQEKEEPKTIKAEPPPIATGTTPGVYQTKVMTPVTTATPPATSNKGRRVQAVQNRNEAL